MSKMTRIVALVGLICVGSLLSGCPGIPGMPGAAGGGEQKMPPGVLPPPGLESGGARTLMGTTITPPDNFFLLVSFTTSAGASQAAEWLTCRRIIPLESCVIVEGLNYDGRNKQAPQDVNQLVPYQGLTSLQWKYEAKPVPPPAPVTEAKPGPRGKPAEGKKTR